MTEEVAKKRRPCRRQSSDDGDIVSANSDAQIVAGAKIEMVNQRRDERYRDDNLDARQPIGQRPFPCMRDTRDKFAGLSRAVSV